MNRLLILLLLTTSTAVARVDTLRSTAAVEDASIYNSSICDPEISGEDCRRYNAGDLVTLLAGGSGVEDHRVVMRFPGWNGDQPDSSVLELVCTGASDAASRRIFIYPLTRRFIEGTESGSDAGGYPDPDSGVTWNHAWLDVGDLDSLSWTTPGGDYTSSVACTVVVSATGVCRIRPFNRILAWWTAMSADPGIVLINQNAFPGNTAMRTFGSSEKDVSLAPRLLLFYGDDPVEWNGRRLKMLTGSKE